MITTGRVFLRKISKGIEMAATRAAHLLPAEYYCHDKWDDLLRADIMQVNLKDYMERIYQDLNAGQRVTATRMDVLASKLAYADTQEELQFAEDVLERFRKTTDYMKIPDSFSHGLIRSYVDVQQADRLLNILGNKPKYGVFLDKFSANILMDTFLEQNKCQGAMKVAAEFALQEEPADTLTGMLSLISTLKYVQSAFEQLFSPWTVEEYKEPEKEEDIERVKVAFIPKFVYDDHFDIQSPKLLCGKMLELLSRFRDGNSQNLQLLGLILHEKYQECKSVIESGENGIVSFGPLCVKALEALLASERTPLPYIDGNQMVMYPPFKCNLPIEKEESAVETLKAVMEGTRSPPDDRCKTEIDNLVNSCVATFESIREKECRTHQSELSGLIEKWMKERDRRHATDTRKAELLERRNQLLARLDELEREEEKLTFFENQGLIEMHYADAEFADESPLLVEVHGEKEFNEKYRKFYQIHRLEPHYYVVHRNAPRPQPPRFRVGAVDYRKLEYANVEVVEPEPDRIM